MMPDIDTLLRIGSRHLCWDSVPGYMIYQSAYRAPFGRPACGGLPFCGYLVTTHEIIVIAARYRY